MSLYGYKEMEEDVWLKLSRMETDRDKMTKVYMQKHDSWMYHKMLNPKFPKDIARKYMRIMYMIFSELLWYRKGLAFKEWNDKHPKIVSQGERDLLDIQLGWIKDYIQGLFVKRDNARRACSGYEENPFVVTIPSWNKSTKDFESSGRKTFAIDMFTAKHLDSLFSELQSAEQIPENSAPKQGKKKRKDDDEAVFSD